MLFQFSREEYLNSDIFLFHMALTKILTETIKWSVATIVIGYMGYAHAPQIDKTLNNIRYSFTESEKMIGESAKNNTSINCENTVFDIKRIIGRKYDDPDLQKVYEALLAACEDITLHIRYNTSNKITTANDFGDV